MRVHFSSSLINGQNLSSNNPEIIVLAGANLQGHLEVIIDNNRGGPWITPVIFTKSWGRQVTGQSKGWFVTIKSDVPTGRTTLRFNFEGYKAPTTPGTHYMGIFTGWMYDGEGVASNDHPAQFGDGDDVWDMPNAGWEEVIINGQASTGPYHMPRRAIRLIVHKISPKMLP